MKNAPQSGQTLSTSRFYMWRCIVAIAHADGTVHEAERAYLERVFKGMERAFGLSAEQKATLQGDLATPQKISELLPYINDPAARSELIYFGGLLARADGELHPSEDAILKKLRADQLSSLDMDAIRKDVQAKVTDKMFQHDIEMSELRPQKGLSGILDALMLRLGIDLMD